MAVATNAAPLYFIALIEKVVELMGGAWNRETDAFAPGEDVKWQLATPYQRHQSEYERATMPRITVGMGSMATSTDDPNGLNDLVTHLGFTVEVAQRLTDKDALGYMQRTMWRVWDIADYLAGRLNRSRLTAEQIGVTDVTDVQVNKGVLQQQLDHFAVTITGRTRLKVDAQRDLMTDEKFYSEFERVAIDDPNAPFITSVGVAVAPERLWNQPDDPDTEVDERAEYRQKVQEEAENDPHRIVAPTPINEADRQALERMRRI